MDELTRHSIGKSYGRALFELGLENGCLEQVADDLAGVVQLVSVSEEFRVFVNSPCIGFEQKKTVIEKTLTGKIGHLAIGFLYVILKHGRSAFLESICDEFSRLIDEHNDIKFVEVTVADTLDDNNREKLIAGLRAAVGSEIKMTVNVNPAIIGGIIIRQGDMLIDNSVSNALEKAVGSFKM